MRLIKSLGFILLTLAGVAASAQTFEVDGINYNVLSEAEGTVEVTSGDYSGEVVIPAEVTYDGGTYSVTTIGSNAFYACDALTSVSMPSVTTIGEYAFYQCIALTSVHIPASCTSIAGNPFRGCQSLEEIVVDENNPNYSSMDGVLYDKDKTTLIGWPTAEGEIDIMPSVTTIGDGAFYDCDALLSVSMPSVTTIGNWAFGSCSSLTSVEMPSATTIGESAFCGCLALTSVSMPSVTTIGDIAFLYCNALTSVSMPSVTTIGDDAFNFCSALTSVDIPASCTSIAGNPFQGCQFLEEIVVDENNPNYSSMDGVLYDKDKTTLIGWPTAEGEIDIMPSVTTIGDEAFAWSEALTSVEMPAVTTIGDEAFYYCSALTSVSMPSVTTIGDYAFYFCSSLTSIDMPSVTTIGDFAFSDCYALTSLDIPASVTTIGKYAFSGCSSLTSVYCHWEQPLECDPRFEETVLANATLYVPDGCVDAYRSVKPWSDFANIVEARYSGIADTPGSGLSVKVIDGVITVEGGDGTVSAPVVEVYSAGGVCVYRGTDTVIGGLGHGIYVVKVGDTVHKVAL